MSEPYKIPKGKFVYCFTRAGFIKSLARDNPLEFPYTGVVGVYRKRCRDYGFAECAQGCRAVNIELTPLPEVPE